MAVSGRMYLKGLAAVHLVAHALANDLSGVHEVVQDGLVHLEPHTMQVRSAQPSITGPYSSHTNRRSRDDTVSQVI